MLKEEVSGGGTGGDDCIRVCDTCQSAPCTVYCRADSAYLCSGCDAQIHAANQVASRHERVWVCEACERAPAAFLCKADAASLCAACDAHIHSANPLARRHHRVPIIPLTGCLYGPPSSHPFGRAGSIMDTDDGFLAPEEDETIDEEDEDEAASWLLINPAKPNGQNNNGFLSGEVDEYLDLVECNSNTDNRYSEQCKQQQQQYNVPEKNYGCDSVVPVQFEGKDQQQFNFQLGIDYDATKPGYSYASVSHSVSVSSLDVGVVPESTITDITASHSRPPKGTIDLFSGPPIPVPTQLSPMDREARVMRYREKKKTRKFEKTIRYASRKAYAESRPRIKGRFAKRSDVEVEVDQMFPNALTADSGYGIVPSF